MPGVLMSTDCLLPVAITALALIWLWVSQRSSGRRRDAFYRSYFTSDELNKLGRDPMTGREIKD